MEQISLWEFIARSSLREKRALRTPLQARPPLWRTKREPKTPKCGP